MTATVNQDIRDEVTDLFIGERTLGDSIAPPLLFVAAEAAWDLSIAATVAIASGIAIAAWRIRRGQKPIYAIAGIGGIAFAAFLALRSGRAESYFLPGIVTTLLYAAGTLVSIVIKRPLSGWTGWIYRGWPRDWFWRDDVRPAYSHASWYWFWYFAIRGLVSLWLFSNGWVEILALWKTLTSWPTIVPLFYFSYRNGVAKRDSLEGPNVVEHLAGAEPPYIGGQRRF